MRTRRDSKSTRQPSEQVREITLASNMTLPRAASPDLPAQIATATALTDRQPSPGTGEGGGSQAAGWGAPADASAKPA
jgi:hypothetical protein